MVLTAKIFHSKKLVSNNSKCYSTNTSLQQKVNYFNPEASSIHVLTKKLDIKTPDDWYRVKNFQIQEIIGEQLIGKNFGWNLSVALKSIYPDHLWVKWKFHTLPSGWWQDKKQQIEFVDWIGEQLGIKEYSDWYRIKLTDFVKFRHAAVVIRPHNNSLSSLLMSLYPSFNWQVWKFDKVPNGWWKDVDNHQLYLNWFKADLNINSPEDWYRIKRKDFFDRKGASLLLQYENSIYVMLNKLYPDIRWKPWLFDNAPKGYWDDPKNLRIFFDWVSEELKISSQADWFLKVSHAKLIRYFSVDLRHKGTLINLLSVAYPELQWDIESTKKPPRQIIKRND